MKIIYKILKESIGILIIAAVLSSIGGFGLSLVKTKLITILPLIILLPALNGMIGNFGAIISDRFTTLLFLGKLKKKWWKSKELHKTLLTVLLVAFLSSIYLSTLANVFAILKGFEFNNLLFLKTTFITILSTFILVFFIISVSTIEGIRVYKKQEDPDNFLIPVTTAIADLGTMLIFSLLIYFIF